MPTKSYPRTDSQSLFPTLVAVQELGTPSSSFVELVKGLPFRDALIEYSAIFGSEIERFELTQTRLSE